jgi:hypothetical protein
MKAVSPAINCTLATFAYPFLTIFTGGIQEAVAASAVAASIVAVK